MHSNRESLLGHWDRNFSVINRPFHSSLPETGEFDEIMSLDRVLAVTLSETRDLYNQYALSGYLRLAVQRIRYLDSRLDSWMNQWHSCWRIDHPSTTRRAMSPMRRIRIAYDEHPSRWGPRIRHLQSHIHVFNQDGEGVLVFRDHAISTILPRYGHTTTIEEVTY